MRDYIIHALKEYYIPLYGSRFLFSLPQRNNPSPLAEREERRLQAQLKKLQANNPFKWPSNTNFATMNDEDLIKAFERIVHISAKQM